MRFFICGCLMFVASALYAEGSGQNNIIYNIVNLDAQATEVIENDTMHIYLYTSHEQVNAQKVSQKINEDIAWALSLLKPYDAIDVQTKNYSIYPQRNKDGKTKFWHGRQELTLTSKNFELLTQQLTQLQDRLKISHMNFSISDPIKAEVEEKLQVMALNNFQKKSTNIAKTMGKKGYDVVELNLNDSGYSAYQPHVKSYRSSAMMSDVVMPEMKVASGKNTVQIKVSGQIQLY